MLHLLNHPLCSHIVTHLRDRTTKPVTFRTLTYQIGVLLAIEATRQLFCADSSSRYWNDPALYRSLSGCPGRLCWS